MEDNHIHPHMKAWSSRGLALSGTRGINMGVGSYTANTMSKGEAPTILLVEGATQAPGRELL
jgi:hypothetical protein